jgi:hypothetical protein
MLALPSDSPISRLIWSVAAGTLILIWMAFLFGGASVPFNTPMTFGQVLQRLSQPEIKWVWPGDFGHHLIGAWLQAGPWLALILWPLCLIQWKTRSATLLSVLGIFILSSGLVLIFPPILVIAPLGGLKVLMGAQDGETWEESFADLTGMALWAWLILFMTLMTSIRCLNRRAPVCVHCGYSTMGLPSRICPECGMIYDDSGQIDQRRPLVCKSPAQ